MAAKKTAIPWLMHDERELIDEFKRSPIGHHSPGLQRLLNHMRGAPLANKYCVFEVKPNREWQLAKTPGQRRKTVEDAGQTLHQKSRCRVVRVSATLEIADRRDPARLRMHREKKKE